MKHIQKHLINLWHTCIDIFPECDFQLGAERTVFFPLLFAMPFDSLAMASLITNLRWKKHALKLFFWRLVLMIVKFLWFFRWKFSRNQMLTILESELKWSYWKDDKIKQILYHAITLSRSICCLFPNSTIANNDYKWLLCHNNCITRDIVYNI